MKLIGCQVSQFEEITDFYKYVIRDTPDMEQYGRWIYGKHPTDEMIMDYICGGYMYYAEENGKMIAAVALTPFQNSDYRDVEWSVDLGDDEVFVVHILCVDPKLRRTGIAKKVMAFANKLSPAIDTYMCECYDN